MDTGHGLNIPWYPVTIIQHPGNVCMDLLTRGVGAGLYWSQWCVDKHLLPT
ncbi:MAG: hypothetical protein U5L01_01645 [Rheinheimera sp.]|nr:hypothetical protein [Rheinheimera sp.]